MEIKLLLTDRLYSDIKNLSNSIGIEVEEYIVNLIEDKFYTDKYGDLNKSFREKIIEDKKETDEKGKITELKEECNDNSIINEEKKVVEKVIKDKPTEKIKKRISRTRTIKSE